MTAKPIFDIRKSVSRRNLEYMIIMPVVVALFIVAGLWLLPDDAVWALSFEALETWGLWGFFGLFLILTALYHLTKLIFFVRRAAGATGEWRFRLTAEDLLWQVPDHAHGPEQGFHVPLAAIKQLEHITYYRSEGPDEDQYWVHFHDHPSIQLREYAGYSIRALMDQIHQAGVPFERTLLGD